METIHIVFIVLHSLTVIGTIVALYSVLKLAKRSDILKAGRMYDLARDYHKLAVDRVSDLERLKYEIKTDKDRVSDTFKAQVIALTEIKQAFADRLNNPPKR